MLSGTAATNDKSATITAAFCFRRRRILVLDVLVPVSQRTRTREVKWEGWCGHDVYDERSSIRYVEYKKSGRPSGDTKPDRVSFAFFQIDTRLPTLRAPSLATLRMKCGRWKII